MVGKLARKLRMMGFDVVYERTSDPERLQKWADEGRVILTRNRRLNIKGQVFQLSSEITDLQVREVLRVFGLREKVRPFTRCIEDNTPLQELPREEAKGRVPFFVYQTQRHFKVCPTCGRVYWRGTHMRALEQELQRLLGEKGGTDK